MEMPTPNIRIDSYNSGTLVFIQGKLVDGIRKIEFKANGANEVDLLLDIDLIEFGLKNDCFTEFHGEKSDETN